MKVVEIIINPSGQLTINAAGFSGHGLREGDRVPGTGAGPAHGQTTQAGVVPAQVKRQQGVGL